MLNERWQGTGVELAAGRDVCVATDFSFQVEFRLAVLGLR